MAKIVFNPFTGKFDYVSPSGTLNVTKIQLLTGVDGAYNPATLQEFDTIQQAINAIPATPVAPYPNQALRKVYEVIIPPGTYDEDITIDITNKKIHLISLGAVNIGVFDGPNWWERSLVATPRNITITCTGGNTEGIRHTLGIGSYNTFFNAQTSHPSYSSGFRVSGDIRFNNATPLGQWADIELYSGAEVWGNVTDISATHYGGILLYFTRARVRGQIIGPSYDLVLAEWTVFNGLVNVGSYATLKHSSFFAGMSVTYASYGGVYPWGMFQCYFAGTFTGPANSCVLDSTTNYYFGINGAILAGGATKVLTEDGGAGGGINQLTGDVTAGPGSGPQVATIAANAVTNAKLAKMVANTVKGNITGGLANPTDVAFVTTNTANSAVLRDASGNFSAGTITAALNGNASSATFTSLATNAQNIRAGFYYTNADLYIGMYIGDFSYEPVQLAGWLKFNPATSTMTTYIINANTVTVTDHFAGNLQGIADKASTVQPQFLYTNADLYIGAFIGDGSWEHVQLGGALTINPATQTLKATYISANTVTAGDHFAGFLQGTADQANKVQPQFLFTNADLYIGAFLGDGSYERVQLGGALTINPSTQTLKATYITVNTITGALSGNATTASSAAKWTTARNLAGNSVDGSANVAFANKFVVQGTSDSGLSGAQFLGALATGIVKNTVTTGVLSIAVAGDFPTLNQSTTGSAAKWTTARTLAGNSVDGSANVAFANKFVVQGTADAGLSGAQFLGALATGIVKNATTTGVLSIAVAGDFPTLNQNTTGSAAKWTTARTLAGNSVDGSANVTFANKFIVQGTADAGLSGSQFLGALATGILKNTTTTGILSIAGASDITGTLLTGFVSGAGSVSASDSILTAFNKLDGNVNLLNTTCLKTTAFNGLNRINVGIATPVNPSVGDLWVDTN